MQSCAITGHRPPRFKFGYKENMSGCKRLKKRLHDQFILLYEQGVRTFYVGGALGVDQWAGEILVAVYDNDRTIRSGTGMTVNYAIKKKRPIILIHPDSGVISTGQ